MKNSSLPLCEEADSKVHVRKDNGHLNLLISEALTRSVNMKTLQNLLVKVVKSAVCNIAHLSNCQSHDIYPHRSSFFNYSGHFNIIIL